MVEKFSSSRGAPTHSLIALYLHLWGCLALSCERVRASIPTSCSQIVFYQDVSCLSPCRLASPHKKIKISKASTPSSQLNIAQHLLLLHLLNLLPTGNIRSFHIYYLLNFLHLYKYSSVIFNLQQHFKMKLTSTFLILLSAASAFADTEMLFADTETFELVQQPSLEQCYPSSIPWVNYEGNDYIFRRMQYNSICVDDKGKQYEWGAIQGVYPSIATPGGGCSNLCVKGYGRAKAKGCSSSQRPDPKKLVGFKYECEKATCYCLYEKDVLSSKYNKCFDSMNTSNTGSGDVTRTTTKSGTTCYSLHIQPSNPPAPQPRKPTRKPTKKPSPTPKGQSICTRSLDYTCYKSGRPQCCSNNNGKDCPKEMTICDNHPEGLTGWNYCSYGPNYNCYKDGQPSCCAKDSMNCPRDQPKCDNKKTTEELASQRFLRSKN